MGLLCQSKQGAQCGAQSSSHGCSVGVSQVKGVWSLAEYPCLVYSQWTDPEGCFPSGDVWGVPAHGSFKEPWHSWCAGWGALGFTATYKEEPELDLFLGLRLRCLYTSAVWCPRCLAARCRRPLLDPWLPFCAGTQLPQEQSKVVFPSIWSTASPGTWDILFVAITVTSLRPSLSWGIGLTTRLLSK